MKGGMRGMVESIWRIGIYASPFYANSGADLAYGFPNLYLFPLLPIPYPLSPIPYPLTPTCALNHLALLHQRDLHHLI